MEIKLLCFGLLIVMTLMGAVAALFLKRASSFKSIKDLLTNIHFYIGGLLYFLSALLNIYILKYLDYSVVLPLTSITYIWTMILSCMILKEKVGSRKMIGIFGIIVGAVLIAV